MSTSLWCGEREEGEEVKARNERLNASVKGGRRPARCQACKITTHHWKICPSERTARGLCCLRSSLAASPPCSAGGRRHVNPETRAPLRCHDHWYTGAPFLGVHFRRGHQVERIVPQQHLKCVLVEQDNGVRRDRRCSGTSGQQAWLQRTCMPSACSSTRSAPSMSARSKRSTMGSPGVVLRAGPQ